LDAPIFYLNDHLDNLNYIGDRTPTENRRRKSRKENPETKKQNPHRTGYDSFLRPLNQLTLRPLETFFDGMGSVKSQGLSGHFVSTFGFTTGTAIQSARYFPMKTEKN
jgi:hypothetical protein